MVALEGSDNAPNQFAYAVAANNTVNPKSAFFMQPSNIQMFVFFYKDKLGY